MATLREIQWALKQKMDEISERDLVIDALEDELINRENIIHSLRKELSRYRGIVAKLTSINNALRKSAASKPGSSNSTSTATLIKSYDCNYAGGINFKNKTNEEHQRRPIGAASKALLDGKHRAATVISAAIAIQNDSESLKSMDEHRSRSRNASRDEISKSSSLLTSSITDESSNVGPSGDMSVTSAVLDSSRRAILANSSLSSSSTSSSIRSLSNDFSSMPISAHVPVVNVATKRASIVGIHHPGGSGKSNGGVNVAAVNVVAAAVNAAAAFHQPSPLTNLSSAPAADDHRTNGERTKNKTKLTGFSKRV